MKSLYSALEQISSFDNDSFTSLVRRSGLSKTRDFIRAELRNMIFDYESLSGFDFSEVDFRGSSFKGTTFTRSILTGAMFDPGQTISVDGLDLNSTDPDFSEIVKLVELGANASQRAERSKALIALWIDYRSKPGVASYVRHSATNDKALTVARALQPHIVGGDPTDKFNYLIDIMAGESSYRHRSKVFSEALAASKHNEYQRNFLMHYAVSVPHVLLENMHDILSDEVILDFVSNSIKSDIVSGSNDHIKFSAFIAIAK